MPFDIRFPDSNETADQDEEFCEVVLDGEVRRIRFEPGTPAAARSRETTSTRDSSRRERSRGTAMRVPGRPPAMTRSMAAASVVSGPTSRSASRASTSRSAKPPVAAACSARVGGVTPATSQSWLPSTGSQGTPVPGEANGRWAAASSPGCTGGSTSGR
jgi:hypothetical protein